MESLERSLNNITIDDSLWRQGDQSQPVWGNGGVQPGRVWGHVPVQYQVRSPWAPESGDMDQNVNEALGISSGSSSQWGPPIPGAPNEFDKIWSDSLFDSQFPPPHARLNGISGGGPDWSTGGVPAGSQQGIWSDGGVGKETDSFWKQQPHQQPQGQWPGQPMPGAWPPRQINHPNGPPPHQQPPRGPMMQQQDFSSGWPPMGLRQKQMNMSWGGDQQRMPGMPQRTGGRPPQQQGRFQGGMQGVDVSVPPPMDMQQMGMGMCQMPPPNHAPWKSQGNSGGQGAQNGGRHQYQQRGGMNHGNGANSGNLWKGGNGGGMGGMNEQYNYNNFQMGGTSDDLTLSVWHDPNGDLKKWQRDLGVCRWGDPEKDGDRSIRLWLVGEGEEEDLETALTRCPIPQKKGEEGNRMPFPIPPKRDIVVTGWEEIPENDPNNPNKIDTNLGLYDDARWADLTTAENPWYNPNYGSSFGGDTTGSWVQGGTIPLDDASTSSPQHALAEMLKYAVDKGYLDISVTMSQNLPPPILANVNSLLAKIPVMESVENELKQLVDSVCPASEEDIQNPQKLMNEVQQVEHNRLIIGVTTAKIEVQDLSKKIQRALIEAGIMQPQQERQAATTSDDNYHYSFLE